MIEIDRDVLLVGVGENALELLLGRAGDRSVDLVLRSLALGHELEIDHRDVGRRDADCDAVELAVELGQHQAHRLGGAGRSRDHRERRGTRAVKILVDLIEARLVVGIGVHRRHEPFLDADGVMQHFGDGSETIGRAGCVGDHEVLLGELVVIDPVDDRQIGALRGCGHEHALGAGLQVH